MILDFGLLFRFEGCCESKGFRLFVSAYDYNNFEKSFEKFCTEHSEKLTTKKRNVEKEKFTKKDDSKEYFNYNNS